MAKKIKKIELREDEQNQVLFKNFVSLNLTTIKHIKEKYSDTLVIVSTSSDKNLGNYYVAINEDAEMIHRDVINTSLEFHKFEEFSFIRFHSYQLDSIIPLLVKKGYKVAICEEIEQQDSKIITAEEKQRLDMIESIVINHWSSYERKITAQFLNDLRQSRNIDFWLYFGNNAQQIISNYGTYLSSLKWDYTLDDVQLNEHGWYELRLENVEKEVEFRAGKSLNRLSFDIVGNKQNTKFTYGKSGSIGTGGFGSGGHICDTPYKSVHDATIAALDDLASYCNNYITNKDSCVGSVQNTKQILKKIKSYKMNYLFQNRLDQEITPINHGLFSNNVIQTTLF